MKLRPSECGPWPSFKAFMRDYGRALAEPTANRHGVPAATWAQWSDRERIAFNGYRTGRSI